MVAVRWLLVSVCSVTVAAPAWADAGSDWSIRVPSTASVTTADTLSVGLPDDLSAGQLARLAVELDQIDVTALARIAPGKLTYAPPQALTAGSHELRVVEYAADGHLVPRGAWRFSATPAGAAARAARGWSVKGSVGATLSERVADSNLTPPKPPPFTANGTFDLKAVRNMAEWTAEATMKGMYGTDNGANTVSGHGLQPAVMQAALRHGKDNLIVGDQTLPYDNLLISGLSRRGVSAHIDQLPAGIDLTGFSVRDSPQAGFYGGFGLGTGTDNVSGGMLQSHPFASVPQALTIFGGYAAGNSPGGLSTVAPYPGNNGTFPPSTPVGTVVPVQSGSGSAWVVGVNSEVPGTTLTLNGQVAGSSFDFPGTTGQAATRVDDNASSAGLNYRYALSKTWALSFTGTYQRVGTYFASLANPTLTPDRRTVNGGASLAGAGLMVGANGGYNEDNTDSNAAVPTVRSIPRNVTVSYGPALPAYVTDWLGAPSLNFSRQDARTHDVTQPSGSLVTDTVVTNNNASLNFAYPRVTWLAGLTDGMFRDHTGQQDDTNTLGPNLGFTLTLGGSGSIGLNAQLLDTHDLKLDTHTLDRNYSLTLADSFWANRFTAQVNLAINHNVQQTVPGILGVQPITGSAITLKTAGAQFAWHAIPATANRGGLDLGLAYSWNDSSGLNSAALTTQGFGSLATRGSQAFLTMSTTWPLHFGDQ